MTLLRMIFQRLPPPVLSVMEINMGAWRTQARPSSHEYCPACTCHGACSHHTLHALVTHAGAKPYRFPRLAQILYTVTHLGVADVLAKGPKTAEQLADAIGAVPHACLCPLTSAYLRLTTTLYVDSVECASRTILISTDADVHVLLLNMRRIEVHRASAALVCITQERSLMLLACCAGCKSEQLYRVMRAAVQLGIFKVARGADVHGRPRFQNNALSAVLREDHPNCLKHMVGLSC